MKRMSSPDKGFLGFLLLIFFLSMGIFFSAFKAQIGLVILLSGAGALFSLLYLVLFVDFYLKLGDDIVEEKDPYDTAAHAQACRKSFKLVRDENEDDTRDDG